MKTVIEMAREAWKNHPQYSDDFPDPTDKELEALERFAALVREQCVANASEDEREKMKDTDTIDWDIRPREKQQEPIGYFQTHVYGGETLYEHVGIQFKDEDGVFPLYTTPPTAAVAARQMRDAAVEMCRKTFEMLHKYGRRIEATVAYDLEKAIAALPVPEVQLPDIEAAVLGEREACAKVCDEVLGENNVSAAIRARGETK